MEGGGRSRGGARRRGRDPVDVGDALTQHREHLVRSGILELARVTHSAAAVRDHARARLLQRLDDALASPAGVALLAEVAAGARSPSMASAELLRLVSARLS